jgi:vancomycin aglycone glucosyltransferase
MVMTIIAMNGAHPCLEQEEAARLASMKVLIAANGSRGDVQPMVALALALRERGHAPLLAASPTFAAEARAFELPFAPVGLDVHQLLREHRSKFGDRFSLGAVRLMHESIGEEMRLQLEGLVPLAKDFDCLVAGGVTLAARTVAEVAGIPFHYVAYTPQALPSAYHVPVMLPLVSAPRWFNRWSWRGMGSFYDSFFMPQLNERRRALGLGPVKSFLSHLFSAEHAWVAADPEIFPTPPDVPVPQHGAFCLADERPLPEELERFLAAGTTPVYIGFGSMPDANPERSTRIIAEAARRVGCRVVLSSGWAELGATGLGPDILTVGPLSHWRLFPRMAGVVHHGGAGTTAASARAGVPQVVVPHAFDQFMLARSVERANLGVSFKRPQLTVDRLAEALGRILRDTSMRETAARTGEAIRQRDGVKSFIQHLTGAPVATESERPPVMKVSA